MGQHNIEQLQQQRNQSQQALIVPTSSDQHHEHCRINQHREESHKRAETSDAKQLQQHDPSTINQISRESFKSSENNSPTREHNADDALAWLLSDDASEIYRVSKQNKQILIL